MVYIVSQRLTSFQHVHMNSTEWKSLSQFAAYLGREGICRVEETEKGLFISWIDNSPETMRKREAIMKKERQDKGDEEREQKLIQEQIERAQLNKEKKEEEDPEAKLLQRKEGEKVKLNIGFGSKPATEKLPSPPKTNSSESKNDTEASRMAAMAGNGIGRASAVCKRACSRPAIARGAAWADFRPRQLRAMPFHRQGERQLAPDRAAVPHPASQISDREPATAFVRRDHRRPSHHAAVPAGCRSGEGRHCLPQELAALMGIIRRVGGEVRRSR